MGSKSVQRVSRWLPVGLAVLSLALFVFFFIVIDTLVRRGHNEAVNAFQVPVLLHPLTAIAFVVGDYFMPHATFHERNVVLPAVSLFVLGTLQWYLTGLGIAQLMTGVQRDTELLRYRVARYITLAGCLVCAFVIQFTKMDSRGRLAWSALIMYALTALVWAPWIRTKWQTRRRPPSGHCASCGYDLTGNVSGRCPECGREIG